MTTRIIFMMALIVFIYIRVRLIYTYPERHLLWKKRQGPLKITLRNGLSHIHSGRRDEISSWNWDEIASTQEEWE